MWRNRQTHRSQKPADNIHVGSIPTIDTITQIPFEDEELLSSFSFFLSVIQLYFCLLIFRYKNPKDFQVKFLKVKNDGTISSLYDNGSSLCAYEYNNDLDIFFKDKIKFEALVNTKSKSTIGWNETRPIRHFELIQLIRENYYNETVDIIKRIKQKINEGNINEILGKFDNTIISPNMKKLIEIFILERKSRILNIYNLEKGE